MKGLAFMLCVAGLSLGPAGQSHADPDRGPSINGKAPLLGFSQAEQPVQARLALEHAALNSGTPSRIGVVFEIEEGWHIYAKDPGDAGMPTRVVWTLPEGFSASDLSWPPHETFLDPGNIQTFGYSAETLLSSRLRVGPEARQGEQLLQAKASWLACNEICIPGQALLEARVAVSDEPQLSPDAPLFQKALE